MNLVLGMLKTGTPDHVIREEPVRCIDCHRFHGEARLICSCGWEWYLGHGDDSEHRHEIAHREAAMRSK